jgi:hypothetical protein
MQLSTGTVTEYKPGQRIAVRVSENTVVTLDLDQNVRVDGLVAEGQLAAVMWMGESGGKRRVTSITAAPGPGDAGTASLNSGYKQMEATPGPKGAVTPGSSSRATPQAGSTTPRTTPAAHADPQALGVGAPTRSVGVEGGLPVSTSYIAPTSPSAPDFSISSRTGLLVWICFIELRTFASATFWT